MLQDSELYVDLTPCLNSIVISFDTQNEIRIRPSVFNGGSDDVLVCRQNGLPGGPSLCSELTLHIWNA